MRLNGGDNVCFFWMFSRKETLVILHVFLDWLILLPNVSVLTKEISTMYQTVIRFANEVKLLQDQIIWCSFSSSILYYFSTKNKQEKRQSKAKQNNKPNQPNQTKPKQKQKTKHHKPKQNNSQKKNLDPKYKFCHLMSPWIMKEQPLRNKMFLYTQSSSVVLAVFTYLLFTATINTACMAAFFPCLIIPVIIHDRTSALKRSASKLIKWNDSLMSALWRDGYEQASILDDACNLCLDLLRNRWAVSPQHFT